MNYTPIRAYDNYINANLERALLQDAGINCYIKDEYTVTIDPLLSPALGGMKLMVEDASVPAAMNLLELSDRLFLETVPCPGCRNRSLQQVEEITYFSKWIDQVKSLLVNGQNRKVHRYYRCASCNRTYDELPGVSVDETL